MNKRSTPQKKVILEYLESVTSHPTAEEIYFAVKKQIPNISKGTVYRVLNDFSKENTILEINSKVSHFDYETCNHAHFICKTCDNIFDACSPCNNTSEKIQYFDKYTKKTGLINSYNIYINGLCEKCLKNNK